MKIILKRDYKLFKYEQVFGATDVFDETLLVDAGTLDTEPVGAVTCTIFTTTKIGTAETGRKYDVNWIWSQMVQLGKVSSGGASPQDAFAVSIKGMKVVPTGEIDTFPAYFRVDIGSGTPFQNVKSAIQKEKNRGNKRPVGVGTYWFSEYSTAFPNTVMPHGVNHVSDHEWVICGWDKEHPNCFKIDTHEGYYKYITEEEFNYVMKSTYGSVALTISQTDQETIDFLKGQEFDLLNFVKDLCYNLLQILKAKLTKQTVQAPTPVIDPFKDYQDVKDRIQPDTLKWSNPADVRHSIRVICDEQKLSVKDKNLICAVIQAESGFDVHAVHKNNNGSTDYGLVQMNDKFWIGQGKYFKDVNEVYSDPKKSVLFMIDSFKQGRLDRWYAYTNGSYKKYLTS